MDDPTRDEPTPDQPVPDRPIPQQPSPQHQAAPRFTRRRMLAIAGVTGVGVVGAGVLATRLVGDDDPAASSGRPAPTTTAAPPPTAAPAEAPPVDGLRWSDPATWGGRVPGPDDVAAIDQRVLLDTDAAVAGLQVGPAGELVFDPAASRTLTSTGNVVVTGAVRARPATADVEHVVTFAGVDESAAAGGHVMQPLDSDVGLWVVDGGVLDLQGAAKRSWTRLTAAAAAGDTTVEVADATGWRAGDEVVVVPTEPTSVEGYAEHHDTRTVTAVDGTTITLDRPLDFPHPEVTVRPGTTMQAEVLNLTRNVRVESTDDGRAHLMFLHVTTPQHLSYVRMRNLGPQATDEEGATSSLEGRYAVHFHMSHTGSRGSVIEGAVVDGGGNHAYVAHLSDGITFRDCIAHDQAEIPYWWDLAPEGDPADSIPTNELVYERCVASLVRKADISDGLTGMTLGAGRGNVARGCVVVGVQGGEDGTSGYLWPAESKDDVHTWVFEDCVAHNNYSTTARVWQNVVPRTILDRFVGYHNRYGLYAGAYANLISYRDCTVYGCAEGGGLVVNAVPDHPINTPDETITYENVHVDQAGLTDFAVVVTGHIADSDRATQLTGCHFTGGTKAQVGFPDSGENRQIYEFVDCTYAGNAFWLASDVNEITNIAVRDAANGSLVLRRADQAGEMHTGWNARVSSA